VNREGVIEIMVIPLAPSSPKNRGEGGTERNTPAKSSARLRDEGDFLDFKPSSALRAPSPSKGEGVIVRLHSWRGWPALDPDFPFCQIEAEHEGINPARDQGIISVPKWVDARAANGNRL
jgi:hypothetical protein